MSGLAFTQGITSFIFSIAFSVWFVSEFIGAFLIPRLRQCGKVRSKRDRGSGLLIIVSLFVSLSVAFNLGRATIGFLPDQFFYLGIFFIFLGITIRQYAIAILGKYFTLTVRVAEDHRVIDKGPYHYVRHPSYTGEMVTFLGLGLAVQSWIATLILLLVFTFAFGYRIRVEEEMLTNQLGQEYLDYMRRTKRLVPFLI